MNDAEKLALLLGKFPGIGPRQARRFVYFLLKSGHTYRGNLTQAITDLAQNIHQCSACTRYYSQGSDTICNLCSTSARTNEQLLIIEKDADLDQLEKSGAYSGRYFVLGGSVRLTDSTGNIPNKAGLLALLQNMPDLSEIILALPTTTEGEHTAEIVQNTIQKITKERNIRITMLGRGLSTGAELEYADGATLKCAFEGRA